ncbi:MAG TPA: hypothetical protein VLT45_25765 [Kofleriaceae bacterium]|nr:hypothetical protein [Kofleriaceae bacterium]
MAKWIALATLCVAAVASAAPPVPAVPAQAHPRLFMRPGDISGYQAAAKLPGSASHLLVDQCQRTIDHPTEFAARGGADGDYWANATIACAFAFRVTGQKTYLAQAMKYWRVSLNDDQTVGDGLGCTTEQAGSTWRTSWKGEGKVPPALITVAHDTWYPIRWFGPAVALAYDWLYDQADEPLRAQSRTCLTGWLDAYSKYGYMREDPGSNYHAGFVIAKTLGAIAIGKDGGADGHLWTEVVRDMFGKQLVGEGLAGSGGGLDKRAGLLVGGDWGSWQYGPLSVLEYAVAARALEEHGAPQPEMKDWLRTVMLRTLYGTLPQGDLQFTGNGDYEGEPPFQVYPALNVNQIDAVLAGLAPDDAAAWAVAARAGRKMTDVRFYNALADLRAIAPKDYTQGAASLWYVARGVGNLYARTSWGKDALWAVFMSGSPKADHAHLAASNFVLSRGTDPLIVDSSNYGEFSTLGTNAVSADSGNPEDYEMTQGPWGLPSLPWARGTTDRVFAARSDFARAFEFNGNPSPINYARRDWVLLPEGEIVTIDRVHLDKGRNMYLNFHAATGGTLALDSAGVATGDAGGSRLAIHRVRLSAGTPKITHAPKSDCPGTCNYPCGKCAAARFPVDIYSVAVPGPNALGIHVLDALAKGEAPAKVDSVNDAPIDAAHQNDGIIGAAILRAGKRSYVVASSATGAAPAKLTYGVPGDTPSRHVVFDAPDARDGTSHVTAQAQGGRCTISIEPGTGGGAVARPLIFDLASAADGCKLTPATDTAAGLPLPASHSDAVIEDVPPPRKHRGLRWWGKRLGLSVVAGGALVAVLANLARARRSRVRAS